MTAQASMSPSPAPENQGMESQGRNNTAPLEQVQEMVGVVVDFASLFIALVALAVAAYALREQLISSKVHALEFRYSDPNRILVNSGTVGERTQEEFPVWIHLIGPVKMLDVRLLAWPNTSTIRKKKASSHTAVWQPGDPPLHCVIEVPDASKRPNQIWVGVAWTEPLHHREGVVSRVRRFPLLDVAAGGEIIKEPTGEHDGENSLDEEDGKALPAEQWIYWRRKWAPLKKRWWHRKFEPGWQKGENTPLGWK